MTLCLHPPSRVQVHGELPDEVRARLEREVLAAVTSALERAAAGSQGVRLGAPAAAAEPVAPERLDRAAGTYRVPGYQEGEGEPVDVPVEPPAGRAQGPAAAAQPARPGRQPEPAAVEPLARPRFEHPHLGIAVDEVRRGPSPFEGATIALLSIDDIVRVGSPRYAVSGALVRAIRWGNLLFGATSYAIYEGPYERPASERRYWTLRTDEPVSLRDLRHVGDIRGRQGVLGFSATGWVPSLHSEGGSFLLRALVTSERIPIFPPTVALLEEFGAEVRTSRPGEAFVPEERVRRELFGEINALIAAGETERAAERLAELDVQAFAVVDWRKRATYLRVLVEAWTSEAEERAIVEVLKASGSRSELDASLELLRREGRFEQLFDDLDSQLFSLLAMVGERFGERGALTLDELAVLMQDTGLIPQDWTSVVKGITFGPAGVVVSTDVVAEAYEAARGFVRFLGGILDAIVMVFTQPQELIEGIAQLVQLILAVELAKVGHRPSQLQVERTLRGIGRQIVFGLRGITVLGVGEHVGRRVKWAVVWEVASWFIGVGEVAAVLKGAGVTERVAAIARMLGVLRRLGEAIDAETLAARTGRLARALRTESRLFAHEDELLHFMAHLPDEDVGRLGRLLREADVAEGVTFAALRQAHPELAEAAGDALRKAEVLKTFAGKAGGLADEVVEAAGRLLHAEGVGVDEAARIVGAIPEREGARFAYALRSVPAEAFTRGEGAELLRTLASSPGRMRALESFGYDAYRALWARAGRSPERFDQYAATLADLQRRALAEGGSARLRELVDGLVEGRPAAWQQLDDARAARFGAAGEAPPAAPPGGGPPGGGPPGGPPGGGLPSAPSGGRPSQQGPPRVLTTGGDFPGRLPFAPPDASAVSSGSHVLSADSAGRPLLAEGWLYPRAAGAGRAPGSAAAQAAVTEGQTGLHGAHLIADRFGGAPLAANIVPFGSEANLSSMRVVENMLADRIASGRQIYVQAYVRYADEGRIPAEVTYRVWAQQPAGTLTRIDEISVDFLNNRVWMH